MKNRNASTGGSQHPVMKALKKSDKAPAVGSRKYNNRPPSEGSLQWLSNESKNTKRKYK